MANTEADAWILFRDAAGFATRRTRSYGGYVAVIKSPPFPDDRETRWHLTGEVWKTGPVWELRGGIDRSYGNRIHVAQRIGSMKVALNRMVERFQAYDQAKTERPGKAPGKAQDGRKSPDP